MRVETQVKQGLVDFVGNPCVALLTFLQKLKDYISLYDGILEHFGSPSLLYFRGADQQIENLQRNREDLDDLFPAGAAHR